MIFEWDRKARAWSLLADTGELIGTARPIPGDCWECVMAADFGGRKAWATDLDTIRDWMQVEAAAR